MTLNDGGAVAGWLAALAAIVTFGYSRTDRAQDKQKDKARTAAAELLDDLKYPERIKTIEVILPRVEQKLDDTAALVKSTNETLNQLAIDVARIAPRD